MGTVSRPTIFITSSELWWFTFLFWYQSSFWRSVIMKIKGQGWLTEEHFIIRFGTRHNYLRKGFRRMRRTECATGKIEDAIPEICIGWVGIERRPFPFRPLLQVSWPSWWNSTKFRAQVKLKRRAWARQYGGLTMVIWLKFLHHVSPQIGKKLSRLVSRSSFGSELSCPILTRPPSLVLNPSHVLLV